MSVVDDFKPASIDPAQPAVIDIEQGNKVKVTVPHVEVSIAFTVNTSLTEKLFASGDQTLTIPFWPLNATKEYPLKMDGT